MAKDTKATRKTAKAAGKPDAGAAATPAKPPPGAAAPGPENDAAISISGLAERFAKQRATPTGEPASGKPAGPAVDDGAPPSQDPPDGNPAAGSEGNDNSNQGDPNPTPAPEEGADAGATPGEGDDKGNNGDAQERVPTIEGDDAGAGDNGDAQERVPTEENPTADLKLPTEVQQKVNARIAKVVGERNAAREETETLKRQLADASGAAQAAQQARNPAANLDSPAKVEDMAGQMRQLLRWCQRNPDGGKLQDKEYDAEAVTTMREAAEDWVEEHLPRQQQFLKARETFDRETVEIFPEIADAKSPLRKEAEEVLAAIPELRNYPHARWISAVAALGMAEYRKREAAKKAAAANKGKPGATAPKPARIITKPAAAPAPDSRGVDEQKAATAAQKFATDGTTESLAERFAANRRARLKAA